ncbi:hypothetical protein [Amycolatopsis sp. MEPSY49]|uniref:hypothetical protein n=1 Tax=Amycolatopsis sp. MEPSY49 TaxID=3151600 RepID=UPI003EF0AF5B
MAVDLAVALLALTTSTAVRALVQGNSPSQQDLAGFTAEVAAELINHAGQSKAVDYGPALVRIERQLAAIPDREYNQHIAAGRRFLQDLPVSWRKARERAEIIRDARAEFVRASAIASESGAVHKLVVAEVAIAGCWLWVPSLPDVQRTLNTARQKLEAELRGAFPTTLMVRDYIDILKLSRELGAVPTHWSIPVDPSEVPGIDAVLSVRANAKKWAYCLGLWAKAGKASSGSANGTTAAVELHNEHLASVDAWLGAQSVSRSTPLTTDLRTVYKGQRLNATLWTPTRGRVALKIGEPSGGYTKPVVAFLVPGTTPPALAAPPAAAPRGQAIDYSTIDFSKLILGSPPSRRSP